MSSRLSVASATGTGVVPFRTSNDADGNAVVSHALALEVGGVATPVSAAAPLPVTGVSGSLGDASGAVGTVSAQLLAAATRRYLLIQNTGIVDVGLNFGAPATLGQGSVVLHAGGSLLFERFVPADAVMAIAAGAGGAVTVKVA